MTLRTLFHLALLLALPPLLVGIVNRTKAIVAGRRGPPLLQAYFDLAKLLRKGAVYSRTTSWVFRAGPVLGLAAIASAGLLLSMGGAPSLVAFGGDFVLFAYLLGLARFVTALAENSRIPVDDPNTHLELTMIHEVMVLDHGGPDLAFILYGASMKLFLFGAILSRLVFGHGEGALAAELLFLAGILAFAVGIGLVESSMARLRMIRVPQLLVGASVLSAFALVLLLR